MFNYRQYEMFNDVCNRTILQIVDFCRRSGARANEEERAEICRIVRDRVQEAMRIAEFSFPFRVQRIRDGKTLTAPCTRKTLAAFETIEQAAEYRQNLSRRYPLARYEIVDIRETRNQ